MSRLVRVIIDAGVSEVTSERGQRKQDQEDHECIINMGIDSELEKEVKLL